MTTKTATRRSTEDRKAQAQQLHDDLTAKIAELTQGDNWKTWLDFAARFRHYSFGNMLLIQAQMPGATHVADDYEPTEPARASELTRRASRLAEYAADLTAAARLWRIDELD